MSLCGRPFELPSSSSGMVRRREDAQSGMNREHERYGLGDPLRRTRPNSAPRSAWNWSWARAVEMNKTILALNWRLLGGEYGRGHL
jgi:hypothetical protein